VSSESLLSLEGNWRMNSSSLPPAEGRGSAI
jgi:hypothetical protein